uniref:Potassium channel tetramerisation-type BTB domain-containing protein n=1 Tax=Tetradesmus obliquus TaxID=3088 RepID=A0A383V9C7_TETOB|eukprot:jgi/Sobl393_1/2074/SZX61204.1
MPLNELDCVSEAYAVNISGGGSRKRTPSLCNMMTLSSAGVSTTRCSRPAAAATGAAGCVRWLVRRNSSAKPCPLQGVLSVRAHAGSNSSGSSYDAGGSAATLAAQRTWLRRQRVLLTEPHPSDADIIELNIGGAVMVASRSTLRQVPGSLLGLLFDPVNAQHLAVDQAGRVFFDYDPAAFALVLRYLRELKVTGGCPSGVLLPPIPPSDAGAFRSLATHLGLRIEEGAITAAAARGAAIAAATAGTSSSSSSAGGCFRPISSPYASRPAAGSSSSSSSYCSQPQQHHWRQQQQLVRPQLPEVPPAGLTAASKAHEKSTVGIKLGSSKPHKSSSAGGGSTAPSNAAAAAAASMGGKHSSNRHQQQQQQQLPLPVHTEPLMQYFYLNTSRPTAAQDGVLPAAHPLRVTVLPESDLQISSSQSSGSSSSSSYPGRPAGPQGQGIWGNAAAGSAGGPAADAWGVLAGFDAFVSTSSSRQLMVLSLVVRSSAALNNVFVGVTSSTYTDQRGMQIPSFGWRQVDIAAADASQPSPATPPPPPINSSGSSSSAERPADPLLLWQPGDLVQLVVELGPTNRLLLKVNGADVRGCYFDLPTFRQWCWYLALFRGTEVAAVVFEAGSFSVYSGDQLLKRYMA